MGHLLLFASVYMEQLSKILKHIRISDELNKLFKLNVCMLRSILCHDLGGLMLPSQLKGGLNFD